jgi:hypothetical protein
VLAACNINQSVEDYPAVKDLGMPLDAKLRPTIIVVFLKFVNKASTYFPRRQ